MTIKTCTKCEQEKELIEFSKDKSRKDGYQSQCKCCVREYRQANKKEIAEKSKELTQAELKEILNYNPDTGIFTWKIKPCNQIHIGDIAGTLNKSKRCGYTVIQINKKRYQTHRLAWLYMTGNFPINQIDHINHIRTDNRIENLRDVTNQENQFNRSLQKDNTSGYTGVHWHKQANKWVTQIQINGKIIHLGLFNNPEEASQAYQEAKVKYHIIGDISPIEENVKTLILIEEFVR